ncbi:PspC domain-containing protein [Actinomadura barringtoniae]|uniref:PspC domain-containing protein n=1 Tax=Actinomadura barringtoniae TaxID=1427535 RepID=A0A939PFY4_9ACTN|nr:PspC domain-containing protein [Actinomadura barringtoniae]MBO2452142.1 PspC domain-containing protein [Actinomadura barringtoniae]
MVEDRTASSPPASAAGETYERMARVHEGRVIAGVCTGMSRYTGIDTVVFRVGFALLTLAHGQGIFLYIAAALFMPADPYSMSQLERLFRRRFDAAAVMSIMGALLCVGVLLSMVGGGVSTDSLAVLTMFGLVMLIAHARGVDLVAAARTFPERLQGHSPDSYGTAARPPAAGPVSLDEPGLGTGPGGLREGMVDLAKLGSAPPPTDSPPAADTPPSDDEPVSTDVPGRADLPTAPRSSCWGAPPRPYGVDTPVRAARQASPLTQFTLLAALVAGVATVPVLHGYTGPQTTMIALSVALAVVGAGLIMGSWFRARGLATVGALLTLALLTTSVVAEAPRDAKYGDVEWRPTDAVGTEQDYKLGVGSATLDLTALPLAAGQRVTINASVILGGIRVKVPRTARIELDAQVALGDVSVDLRTQSGPRAKMVEVLQPDGMPKNPPVIELQIRGKVGDVQVNRV